MKTLQIWIENKDTKNKPYMESVIKGTPNVQHFFIGPRSASVPGQVVLKPEDEIAKAYALLGNTEWWQTYCSEAQFTADMLRCAWALKHPDLLYVDADIEFTRLFVEPKPLKFSIQEQPYIGEHNGFQEWGIFYVNGCSAWFQAIIDYTIKRPFEKYAFMMAFAEIAQYQVLPKPFRWAGRPFYLRHK